MKILVTGGAGFIGSHIIDSLINQNHTVVIIDDLSMGRQENINKGAIFYELKIESPKIETIFADMEPDIVFHLAAQVQVKKSTSDPYLDANVNILGTINLLQLSLKYKVKKFIFSSSGGVMYGNTSIPATEECPEHPLSPYGISKWSAEQYIKYYGSLGLRFTILRYANVYGLRQDPFGEAGVVAIWANSMLNGEQCTLYGFGKLVRDYVFVDDVVRANIKAMERGLISKGGDTLLANPYPAIAGKNINKNNSSCSHLLARDNQIINIGTGVPTSVDELFNKMSRIIGYSLAPVYQDKREGEVGKNFLNCTKANKLLGWTPKTNLSDGLAQTIQWFKEQRTEGKIPNPKSQIQNPKSQRSSKFKVQRARVQKMKDER
ncbi:MAG: NAD-dependent epimerase/dehydratase family protein [Candidatus Stahlbacteria bacterium]|nr:NAD-dependent epimerase/dehydratase family protein [Candidatus Stahlbacteria bacterium]